MIKKQVKIGSTYLMNHSSGIVEVHILRDIERFSRSRGVERCHIHWAATNLKTGREIEIKSAAKLLRPLTPAEIRP